MAKVKLSRTLFIGLGGTGMNALLHTKKLFMETYNEVPKMIGFLGLDTDGFVYKKTINTKDGREVRLEGSEQVPIQVADAASVYKVNSTNFGWVPEKNVFALKEMMKGAGQIRSNGRFAFVYNKKNIEAKVKSSILNISQASITQNSDVEILDNNVKIHMVFSLCGGTGCGTFIDMAALLRSLNDETIKITGYGILPNVFENMAQGAAVTNVKPNAYGAIKDLDYLIESTSIKNPLRFPYMDLELDDGRLFNHMFLVDNMNRNGDTYSNIDQISEMLGLSLYTSTGAISGAVASREDNVEKNADTGCWDVLNKKAWVSGLGTSEILFNGDTLAKVYAGRAAMTLIEKIIGEEKYEEAENRANAWIDEVRIRENQKKDDVIDKICSITPKSDVDELNKKNVESIIQSWLDAELPKTKNLDDKIQTMGKEAAEKLHALVCDLVKKESYGIKFTKTALDSILVQPKIFLGEMNEELNALKNAERAIEQDLDNSIEEYKKFHFGNQQYIDEVNENVARKFRNKADNMRHTNAIAFFNQFINVINKEMDILDNLFNTLKNIYGIYKYDWERAQNSLLSTTQNFQIDLTVDAAIGMIINKEAILLSDFVKKNTTNIVYELAEKKEDEIKTIIDTFTENLEEAKNYRKITLDEALQKQYQNNPDGLKKLSTRLISKAEALFSTKNYGYAQDTQIQDTYYIGVRDKENNIFAKDNLLEEIIKKKGNEDVEFVNTNMNDRIVVYHRVDRVPPFMVAPIDTFKNKYERAKVDCHFDAGIELDMERSGYDLFPTKQEDTMLEYWVKGFIFGLIKNENGSYCYRNKTEGKALNDYWVKLDAYRDKAYAIFKQKAKTIENEFPEAFEKECASRGEIEITALYKDVAENYFDKYSQCGLSLSTLNGRGYKETSVLLEEELRYITQKLVH